MSKKPSSPVCISAMGMACSLGHDVVTACAAARAGIVRAQELDYYQVRSPEDGSTHGATGHVIRQLTPGFEGHARLMRIAQAALSDLQRHLDGSSPVTARMRFYLALPDPLPEPGGEDEDDGEDPIPAVQTATRLLQMAARASGWPTPPPIEFLSTSGHAGVAEAVERAIDDLETKKIDGAVVGGIDSLLDEDTLSTLEDAGRLKTPATAAGLQPGEAGAFFLIESVEHAIARRRRALGLLRAVVRSEEPAPLGSDQPTRGEGLTQVLTEMAALDVGSSPLWLVTDQNGEPYRALEWGTALVRTVTRLPGLAMPTLWYPAASFGDTRAASGALGLCVALRAMQRGYAPASQAILLSASDGPARAGVLLSAPEA